MEALKRRPEKPGELVIVDNGNVTSGFRGWSKGPKFDQDEHSDSFFFEQGEIGIVVAVWRAQPNQLVFNSGTWHYILVGNKGLAWFPMGWTWTLDYAHAEWQLFSNGAVAYDGV